MAEEKIKLPRSSYDELCKIITAYGHQKEPVAPKTIAATAALKNETIVSANNKFLLDVGIIEGTRNKIASPKGKKLAQALDLQMPDEIRSHWREIIYTSNFLSRILSAVKIRKGMDETTLQSHIAYSAGEPNKGFVMTGARAVIDIIKAAELLKEEDGKLTAVDITTIDLASDEKKDEGLIAPSMSTKTLSTKPIVQPQINYSNNNGMLIELKISVNLDCTPSDLEGLGTKLNQLVEDLTNSTDASLDNVTELNESE